MFAKKLRDCQTRKKSLICVGLDSDIEKIPSQFKINGVKGVEEFNKYIISVPWHLAKGLQTDYLEWGFLYLPLEGLDLYYNRETGFARLDPGTIIF